MGHGILGGDGAVHIEPPDHAALAHDAEQPAPPEGAAPGAGAGGKAADLQVPNGVAVAFKGPHVSRRTQADGVPVLAGQIDVGDEAGAQVPVPGVHLVPEVLQLLGRGDEVGIVPGAAAPGVVHRPGGQDHGHQQREGHCQGQGRAAHASFYFHSLSSFVHVLHESIKMISRFPSIFYFFLKKEKEKPLFPPAAERGISLRAAVETQAHPNKLI